MDYRIAEFLSKLLGAEAYTLTPQHLLSFFVVPFFLMWFAFYLLLKQIRIFRGGSQVINLIISGVVAFSGIKYGFGIIGAMAAVCYFLFRLLFDKAISMRRKFIYVIIMIIVFYVLFMLLPFLIENWSRIFPYY